MASTIAGSDGPSHSLTNVPDLSETARSRRGQPDVMNGIADQADPGYRSRRFHQISCCGTIA
jgi:hypothetical protein